MIKFVFKWIFRLGLLAVVLAVVFFLSLDTILRVVMENRIRAQTGMDAEIGAVHFGLTEPVVSLRNLKLYNSPAFGGTPFLDLPEIHVEYDRLALANHKIHLTLLRLNLGEFDIVKNEAGRTNIFLLGGAAPVMDQKAGGATLAEFKRQTGFEFQSVDVLNVSVGTVKYLDLKNPANNREQKIGIASQVIKNVQSPADLAGLALLVALRSGDFFGQLVAPGAGFK